MIPLVLALASLALPLHADGQIPLGGGSSRFDYASLDARSGRLYVAHQGAGRVEVVDARRRRKVAVIPDLPRVHGVLAVPRLGRLYASATGARQLVTLDLRTRRVLARTPAGAYPDGIAYAPDARRVFVSDETGGVLTAVAARTGRAAGTVALGGEAGNVQYDGGSGEVLADVQSADVVAVVDPRRLRVIRTIPLPGCEHDHGLLVDAPRRLAFVACDRNARLLVVDLRTGRVVGSHGVGSNPDVLAFDPGLRRLYVASESGVVTVFAERRRRLALLGQGFLAAGAHSVAVDPVTHRVYFPLERGAAVGVYAPATPPPRPVAAPVPPPAIPSPPLRSDPCSPSCSWTPFGPVAATGPTGAVDVLRHAITPSDLAIFVVPPAGGGARMHWHTSCTSLVADDYTVEDDGTVATATPTVIYPHLLNPADGPFTCDAVAQLRRAGAGTTPAAVAFYRIASP